MNQQSVPWIICIMSGVFGGVFLLAFLAQFDSTIVSAGKTDDASPGEKKKHWVDAILSMTGRYAAPISARDYKRIWAGTEGQRFLIPLGLFLCGLSWVVHHFWISGL